MVAACLMVGISAQMPLAYGHGGGHGGGGHGGGGGHMGGGHSGGGHMGGGHHTGGGGHHHHHYGGGGFYGGGFYPGFGSYYGSGYGLGYGSRYYGNGYGYNSPSYYSQPMVQSYPVYATQQYGISTPQYVPDGGEIVLFSPASVTTDIPYTLNGIPYAMKPNSVQRFTNDRQWTIEFPSTGNGSASLRYSLVTGRYKFKPSGSGMGLFQTQDPPDTPTPATLAPAPTPSPPN